MNRVTFVAGTFAGVLGLPIISGVACGHGVAQSPAPLTPEVPQNVDTTIGNFGLTNLEEDQLVAFLKILTDGYKEPSAYPQKVP